MDGVPADGLDGAHEGPRPWVRLLARWIDYHLATIPLTMLFFQAGVIDGLIGSSLREMIPETAWMILPLIMWIPIEAGMLSTWGATPGKALLATRVTDGVGGTPRFGTALYRSGFVWCQGVAAGIACIIPFTASAAYVDLVRKNSTRWDRATGLVVTHAKLSPLRVVAIVLVCLVLAICDYVSYMPQAI